MQLFSKLINKLGGLTLVATVAGGLTLVPALDSSLQTSLFSNTSVFAASDEDQREPPPTRSSQQLSRQVYRRIEEVVEFQDLEQYGEALEVLDELKEMHDDERLNDREKYMMWVFYANIAQAQERFGDALSSYNEILELDNMRGADVEAAMRITGQLYFVLEDYQGALDAYLRLIDYSLEPDPSSYLRVANAHYQLENYAEAIPYMETHMEMERAVGKDIPEATYSLLGALYFTVEDYPSTRQVVRERVVLFNNDSDWSFLAGVNGQLDNFEQQAYLYYTANILGFLNSENQLMNLAAQYYNNENPYGGAVIVQKGMDDGIIEVNEANLSFLATAYQIAREDTLAAIPLERAAELSDDGELYARLGTVFSNLAEFELAIEAFNNAYNKGGLDREDQVRMRQARAFRELNRFDEGIEAARLAGRDERSDDVSETWVSLLTREKEIYESRISRRAELQGFFR